MSDKHQRAFISFCEEILSALVSGEDPDAIAQSCQYFAMFEARDNHANNALALCEIRDMAADISRRELGPEYGKLYVAVASNSRDTAGAE